MKIGVGCVNLGSSRATSSWRRQIALVREAIDAGVTVFDTADAYGSGASEIVLGRAIRGRRDGLTIATKGGYEFRPRPTVERWLRRLAARLPDPRRTSGPGPSGGTGAAYAQQDFRPERLREQLEASLRRLQIDRVDVYQLHGPGDRRDDLLAELADLRDAGKVGRFGVGAESIGSALSWSGDPEIGVIQLPLGVLDPDAATEVIPVVGERDVWIWARAVLGGGVIAAAIADARAVADDPKAALLSELGQIASDAGLGLDELAIRWVLAQRRIDTVLLGISSPAHLRRNLELAGRPPLDDEMMRLVAAAQARTRPPGATA